MKALSIVGGVVGVLVGMGFVMPALALLRTQGAPPGMEVALLFLGVFVTLGGLAAAWRGVRVRA